MSNESLERDLSISPPRAFASQAGVQPAHGQDAQVPELKGRMGVLELMFTVLAFTAPIVVVTAFIPFVFTFGGLGAPVIFGLATVLLLLFAVGYTTMTRFLPNPGAFYAYITAGLGRPIGLASSFMALFGYAVMAIGTYCFFGVVTSSLISTTFGGPSIAWFYFALAAVLITGILGYFRIDISAKALTIAMICEVAIVAIYDGAVFFNGGPEGRSMEAFSADALASGSIGLGVLFAAASFLGFEATAIFKEEVRDPHRTVPQATYLSVITIGIFYVVTSWLTTVAYGPSRVLEEAAADPAGLVPDAAAQFVGLWARDVITILVVTSAFAAVLAVQNILSRYVFSLGMDRVLPGPLGKVHPRHGSPYLSSLLVTAVTVAVLLSSLATEPIAFYTKLAGIGGFALMLLIFLTGVSVIVFFRRRRDLAAETTIWHTMVSPFLGAVGMGIVLYLSATNFDLIAGGSAADAAFLQISLGAVFVTGLVVAAVYRTKKPDVYARIGRQTLE